MSASVEVEKLGLSQLAEAVRLVYRLFRGLMLLLALAFCASGVHVVPAGKVAHVMRFGRFLPQVEAPGFHLALPFLVDRVFIFDTNGVRSLEVTAFAPPPLLDASTQAQDYLMTREGSILHAKMQFTYALEEPLLAWRFAGPSDLAREHRLLAGLFQHACLRAAGELSVDAVLLRPDELRARIADLAAAELRDQGTGYKLRRVDVVEITVPGGVGAAFNEVQRQAIAKEKLKSEAETVALGLERSLAAEQSRLISAATTTAARLKSDLAAEARLCAILRERFSPAERSAYLALRLQGVLQKAVAASENQVFLVNKGELRMKLGPDPLAERQLRKKSEATAAGKEAP